MWKVNVDFLYESNYQAEYKELNKIKLTNYMQTVSFLFRLIADYIIVVFVIYRCLAEDVLA